MGFGLALLGGMAQGLGQGMVQAEAISVQERRDRALEEARRASMTKEYELRDANDAKHSIREANVNIENREDTQQFSIDTAREGAAANNTAKAAERAWQDRRDAADRAFKANQAAADRAAQREIEWGKPLDSFIDETTGDVTMVYRGGKTDKFPGIAKPKPAAPVAAPGAGLFASDAATAQPNYVYDAKTGALTVPGAR